MEASIERLLCEFTLADLPPVWSESIWPAIQANTNPPHYLVGGAITRTIINKAYGMNLPIRNYDLVVWGLFAEPKMIDDWAIVRNMFGDWKVVSKTLDVHVDVWPYHNWQRHKGSMTIQKIEDALATVPVNIHAVAYEIRTQQIHFHPEYVRGLTDHCVRVLCKPEHDAHCRTAKVTPEQDLKYRADRFGFTYEL